MEDNQLIADQPGYSAFEARDDLAPYGSNALLLFAAQMKLGLDDVVAFATNALTDHSNDKKCDLVAVVNDGTRIIVAQGYLARSVKHQRRKIRRVTRTQRLVGC